MRWQSDACPNGAPVVQTLWFPPWRCLSLSLPLEKGSPHVRHPQCSLLSLLDSVCSIGRGPCLSQMDVLKRHHGTTHGTVLRHFDHVSRLSHNRKKKAPCVSFVIFVICSDSSHETLPTKYFHTNIYHKKKYTIKTTKQKITPQNTPKMKTSKIRQWKNTDPGPSLGNGVYLFINLK